MKQLGKALTSTAIALINVTMEAKSRCKLRTADTSNELYDIHQRLSTRAGSR